jgi:hypothetical protein
MAPDIFDRRVMLRQPAQRTVSSSSVAWQIRQKSSNFTAANLS